jgi:hypothetical protein
MQIGGISSKGGSGMSWGAQNRSKDAKLQVHRAAGPKTLNWIYGQSSHTTEPERRAHKLPAISRTRGLRTWEGLRFGDVVLCAVVLDMRLPLVAGGQLT